MKVEIYDPAMCCSSGLFRPALDPLTVNMNDAVLALKKQGIKIERHNLARQLKYFTDLMRNRFSIIAVLFMVFALTGYSQAVGIDDALNNAKKEGKIVMLELGSVGCIPCEQMKPVMEKLRTNYKGKIEVIFIDVRMDREPGRRFGVSMIPTQVFLDKNGKEFHRHIGFYAYEEIEPMLNKSGR